MASFLDNSGDIILDAVLTDYGRQLLARGDGSFNIVKFALGDDEIDYARYSSSLPSALKDQDILNTPILEAMTNNAASMKSKLLTITSKNLLFMPILKLNATVATAKSGSFFGTYNGYVTPSDFATYSSLTGSSATRAGLLYNNSNNYVRVDQGLDSIDTDKTVKLSQTSPDLFESEYNIVIDNRFGIIASIDNMQASSKPVIDDDGMATYKLTLNSDPKFVAEMVASPGIGATTDADADSEIRGTRGSKLSFEVLATTSLTNGNYFDKYGTQYADGTNTYKVIKTVVKVTGATTGYSIDIPVAFAKKV
jgi:hypothetical protein